MDKFNIDFEDFEQLLQEQSFRKPSALYSKVLNSNEQTYKPQDVIETVHSQIKAIQLADCAANVKSDSKVTKSNFLPISKLPLYNDVPKSNLNKSETQCLSDTQLMSVIEGAEAVDTHTGMTQEFNTTFTHIEDKTNENRNDDKENKKIPKMTSNVKKNSETSTVHEGTSNINNSSKNEKEVVTENICKIEDIEDHKFTKSTEIDRSYKIAGEIPIVEQSAADLDIISFISSQISKTATADTITFIENMAESQETKEFKEEFVELKNILNNSAVMDIDTGQNTQRSRSPVLNMKAKKRKSRTPSPLVVSLESFENFENMAMPLIEENTDLDTAKYLINSQILGRELCLNSNKDVMFAERNYSPVLEWKSDELQINSQDLKTPIVKQVLDNVISLNHEIGNCENFKDEILFSSDEENEYIYKELQVLPPTCALQTSFSEESGVLEKTMYVGFQTASGKSIQICTDSFDKAKSILDDNDRSIKDFILTDLVEKFDILNSKPEKTKSTVKTKSNAVDMIKTNALESKSDFVTHEANFVKDAVKESKELCKIVEIGVPQERIGVYTNENPLKKQSFNGFMTASFKKIKMPDKILERCQKIFKDIDLNENFDSIIDSVKAESNFERKSCLHDNDKNDCNIKNVEDVTTDDKINDALLLQEFENTEMLLKEKETNNERNKHFEFECFKTANNKSIKISDEAMAKTKNIFQDIDVEFDKQKNEINAFMKSSTEKIPTRFMNSSIGGDSVIDFKSTNNKKTNISPQAFINTKNTFQDTEIVNEIVTRDINQPSTSEEVFVGFKTANNKEIKISDETLSKSKTIFKDIYKKNPGIEAIENINHPSASNAVFVGFNTSSHKNISIPKETSSKHNNILKNIDKEISILSVLEATEPTFKGFETASDKKISEQVLVKSRQSFENTDIDSINMPRETSTVQDTNFAFYGFKTANNKSVNISAEAFLKSKNLFADLDSTNFDSKAEICVVNKNDYITVKGFQTASNKTVVSADALRKGKIIFQDMDKVDEILPLKASTNAQLNENQIFEGFQTASKKAVSVSADALAKSKRIFQDMDKIDEIIPLKPSTNAQVNKNHIFEGFQTASKKAVTVSADALARSKIIFQDIDKVDEIIPLKPSTNAQVNKNHIFEGFQTASKKAVTVSADALARSKLIFQDIDKVHERIHDKVEEVSRETVSEILNDLNDAQLENLRHNFIGFKTASNKNVSISEEALSKSKKLLDDIEVKCIAVPIPLKYAENNPTKCIFNGLQTANNKKVEISKKALERTKNLFDDIDSCSAKTERRVSFNAFETANNNKLTVSDQALAISRLFYDVDTENANNSNNTDKHPYNEDTQRIEVIKSPIKDIFGLKTGNNKNIAVSEDALEKSKKRYAEEAASNTDKNYSVLERKTSTSIDLAINKNTGMSIEGILNTQILNDFEVNLSTENFKSTPIPNKRSGSPILSCPRAKKRKKFETPYKSIPKTVIDFNKNINEEKKPLNVITFTENYKNQRQYTLQDLDNLENNSNKTIDPYILNFNLENILDFEFDGVRNDLKEDKINIEELKRLFAEATIKKLIPEGWMDIHLKLILWKLISYEIKFPNCLGTVCTVRNVIDQLKYRYDRELYNAERPVLRKILEKDDIPTKDMVLCVVGIYVDGVSVTSVANLTNIELLLTDGWYIVKATIDKMLSKLVYDGKIVVGSKILTCGAELVNCEQGVAPWEDTSSVRLKIFGNSTKPARWWTRLGRHSARMLCQLSAVKVDGGKAARLRVRVTRVYPPLYVERLQDGSTVTRSERLEHQYQTKYEAGIEVMVEKIYGQVEKEFSEEESLDSEGSMRNCCDSGSEIAQLMKKSKDPMEFRAQLTPTQVQLLQDHISRQRDRYLQAVQDRIRDTLRPRSVVTLVRGRVAALDRGGGRVTVNRGTLSIWKPSDAVLEVFREGAWIEVMNVVPTAVRNMEIQLSAGRQSVFRQIKSKEEISKPYLESLKRICYTIKYISQNPSITTDNNEIDTVGIIFSIDPSNRDFESMKNQFQNVYLADIDKNMICVIFWGGIKKFGYENVLETGQLIYCGNLQKRAGNTRKNIPQYRATEFSLFTKTPKNVNARETVDEINKKMFGLDRRKFCENCIAVKQNYSAIKCFNDSENVSPYRFNNSDYNLGKHKMFIETPVGVKVFKGKAEDFSLTGLDFESTFKQEATQELSSKTLLRKNKVNEKIAKLKMYGEPPPLTPLNIINKTKDAANSYKSPLILKSDSAITPKNMPSATSVNNLNVATKTKSPDECAETDNVGNAQNLLSPIIPMNRTYVKQSRVNPVKLNFSETATIEENADNTVDHFAEEFDGSPPLSLD